MELDKYFFCQTIPHKKSLYEAVDKGVDFLTGKTQGCKVLNYETPERLKELVAEGLPQHACDISKIFEELEKVGKFSISQSDLRYIAFPDSGNSIAALVGDIYSKFINQNLTAVDRSAPIATFVEIQVIEWLRELIGYDSKPLVEIKSLSEVSGMCTTGGHMSNHIAIMTALNEKYPDVKKHGVHSLNAIPKIVLAGDISHYSFSSAMHHLGLGQENIINVKSNEEFITDIKDLTKVLEEHTNLNDIFMVVSIAGNSRTSSIDNIKEMAEVCQKYKVWLHVDACHGGSLLFSRYLKNRDLQGIELADSVSLDPHKGMFVTYPLSYIIFKKRDALVNFTRYEKNVRDGSAWDLGYITPFYGSRGFESLRLWLLIKHIGVEKLAKIVEERDANAKFAAELLKKSGLFQLFHEMTFYRLVFVYLSDKCKEKIIEISNSTVLCHELKKCVDYYTHALNERVYKDGDLTLDEFKLHDLNNATCLNAKEERFYVSSITIANPHQTKESISRNIRRLVSYAKEYEQSFSKDFENILSGSSFVNNPNLVAGPAGWK